MKQLNSLDESFSIYLLFYGMLMLLFLHFLQNSLLASPYGVKPANIFRTLALCQAFLSVLHIYYSHESKKTFERIWKNCFLNTFNQSFYLQYNFLPMSVVPGATNVSILSLSCKAGCFLACSLKAMSVTTKSLTEMLWLDQLARRSQRR